MKSLELPMVSTKKPFDHHKHNQNGQCTNHLQQDFNQKAPALVWGSDFTHIKASSKWSYLYIVMDLYSRKIIAWNISGKLAFDLVIIAFKKAYKKRNTPFFSQEGTSFR